MISYKRDVLQRQSLRAKEEGDLPACCQRSVQKPVSRMVWGAQVDMVWAACMFWKALSMLKGI